MTVSRNKSVPLNSLADEHDRLIQSISQLRRVLSDRDTQPASVGDMFQRLADMVQEHFDDEEVTEGFFDRLVEEAPWLHPRAQALIQEHQALALQLSQLTRAAARRCGSADWWRNLQRRLDVFLDKFRNHERREQELMQAAYYQDLGGVD